MEVRQCVEIAAELLLPPGGDKETVDHQHQQHRQQQIEDPQTDGHGVLHGQGGHGHRKGRGEDGVDPGPGGAAVHKGDHHKGKDKDAGHTGQKGIDHKDQQTAQGRADGPGDHPVGALLIAGLNQKKRVEGEPVGVFKVPQEADGTAHRQHHRKPQGKAHLKPLQGEALPQAPPQLSSSASPPERVPDRSDLPPVPEQEEHAVEKAPVKNAQAPLGQRGIGQHGLDLFRHRGTFLRGLGSTHGPDQPGQALQRLPPLRRQDLLLPGRVGHQVDCPLEQDRKHIVKEFLGIGGSREAVVAVSHAVEALFQPIQLLAHLVAPAFLRHALEQSGQTVQTLSHTVPLFFRPAPPPAIARQGQNEGRRTGRHRQKLRPHLLRRRRPELQKHKGHGIADIPLGGKLAALKKDQ